MECTLGKERPREKMVVTEKMDKDKEIIREKKGEKTRVKESIDNASEKILGV